MNRRFAYCLSFVATALASCVASADPIVAGTTSFQTRAVQDVTLFANTSINPTNVEIFIGGLFGDSVFGINREQQVGDTIVFNSIFGAQYTGSLPGLGDYVFGNVGPFNGSDYTGSITNIVQDPNDPGFASGDPSSFVSGDFLFEGNAFGFEFLSGPLTGVILTTDLNASFSFTSTFDGLPSSSGTVLLGGGGALNVFLGNELVGTSDNRFISVVPEPTAAAIIGLCSLMLLRRKK